MSRGGKGASPRTYTALCARRSVTPALVTRKDWVFRVTFGLESSGCPAWELRTHLLVLFYLCACSFTFTESVVFLQGKDLEIQELEVGFAGVQSARQLNEE